MDCTRRAVSLNGRLLRAGSVGALSVTGFLVPYVFSTQLQYLYFQILKPRPIAVSPYEWVAVNLTTGLLLAVLFVFFYVAGSRSQKLPTF
ncbi:hypothetical protein [Haladaptatus sp. DJG-WS-42]|uniref:hypothetical protein n=1 Tax=Haladaptatus sp. DJG-WS-42 TaxID=3120516 RepID=UPI0030D4A253